MRNFDWGVKMNKTKCSRKKWDINLAKESRYHTWIFVSARPISYTPVRVAAKVSIMRKFGPCAGSNVPRSDGFITKY